LRKRQRLHLLLKIRNTNTKKPEGLYFNVIVQTEKKHSLGKARWIVDSNHIIVHHKSTDQKQQPSIPPPQQWHGTTWSTHGVPRSKGRGRGGHNQNELEMSTRERYVPNPDEFEDGYEDEADEVSGDESIPAWGPPPPQRQQFLSTDAFRSETLGFGSISRGLSFGGPSPAATFSFGDSSRATAFGSFGVEPKGMDPSTSNTMMLVDGKSTERVKFDVKQGVWQKIELVTDAVMMVQYSKCTLHPYTDENEIERVDGLLECANREGGLKAINGDFKCFESELCVVCMVELPTQLYLPCSHKALCKSCSDHYIKTSSKCPMCRSSFKTTVDSVELNAVRSKALLPVKKKAMHVNETVHISELKAVRELHLSEMKALSAQLERYKQTVSAREKQMKFMQKFSPVLPVTEFPCIFNNPTHSPTHSMKLYVESVYPTPSGSGGAVVVICDKCRCKMTDSLHYHCETCKQKDLCYSCAQKVIIDQDDL
jgi:hypothetical protein